MLFHVGALWRLNELGYLPRLDRVSSVSGGSITAGVLGLALGRARLRRRRRRRRLRRGRSSSRSAALAGDTIDVPAIVARAARRGSIGDRVADAYREHLFGDATLQDLPDAAALRHQRDEPAVGRALALLEAVHAPTTASARSPTPRSSSRSRSPPRRRSRPSSRRVRLRPAAADVARHRATTCSEPPFTARRSLLADGGVYDNLGLETAWKRCRTVLVSDGGGQMGAEAEARRGLAAARAAACSA